MLISSASVGELVDRVLGEVELTPSVASSALYCLIRLASGSVRMRRKSSRVSGFSSTRIGRRPCSSGNRSEGLARWNAPEAMNSTWSVLTAPCLVATVVPSISGSRSRCTPSRLTSAPMRCSLRAADLVDLVDEDDAVLLDRGDRLARRPSPGRGACRSPPPSARAWLSATVMRRGLVRPPNALPKISPRLSMPICAPGMPGMSKVGIGTPPLVLHLDLDLLARRARPRAASCGTSARVSWRRLGAHQRVEHALLGARARPSPPPPCAAARASWRCAISTRSRTICSTSRPT